MRSRVKEWIARYAPAEITGIIGTYIGFWLVMKATGSLPAAGFGAAIGENAGFYGLLFVREWWGNRDAGHTLRTLAMEFGLAELLDSLIVRPGATVLAVMMLGEGLGVFVGKVAADVVFYVLAISVYERLKAAREGGS
jgi:hypothetical protein